MHLITEGDPPMIMAAVTKNNKQGLSAASTHRFKARLVPIKLVVGQFGEFSVWELY